MARYIVSTQQSAISKIQHTFSIGFNRVGRLMKQLEEVGIVGSVNREVYVQSKEELNPILETLKAEGRQLD